MSDLHCIERIRVVVDVLYLLPGKLDDRIPAFESGFFRRAATANTAEFHADDFLRVVWDAAEICAQVIARAAVVGAFDSGKWDALFGVRDIADDGV